MTEMGSLFLGPFNTFVALKAEGGVCYLILNIYLEVDNTCACLT